MASLPANSVLTKAKPAYRFILPGIVFFAGVVLLTLAIYWTVARTNALQPDFYTFWMAGKALFVEHLSPYSSEVTLRSQIGIYGRAALPGEDQVGFAYPLHSLWLVLPTVWMNFPLATSFWMSLTLMSTVTVLYLNFPKKSKLVLTSFLFFYPYAYGLMIGNFSMPLGVLYLIVYGFLVDRDHPSKPVQIICGLLLAVLTIKPQLMGILLIAILLFALRKKYLPLLAGFGVGLIGLIGSITLWLPSWPVEWIRRLSEYSAYQVDNQPLAMIYSGWIFPEPYTRWVGYALVGGAAVLTLILGTRWWKERISTGFFFAWCGLVTLFVDRFQWSSEQIVLLVPLLFWTFGAPSMKNQRLVVWIAALSLSWVTFSVSLNGWAPGAVDQWPFLFYLVWIGFRYLREKSAGLSSGQLRTV